MAISVNWANKEIFVPRADMVLIQTSPTEIRQLDVDVFRLALKDLEDGVEGIIYDSTHSHVAPITVGGVSLARVVEFINDYTITFEDGQYAVNLVGANTNLADVVNVNQVSVRSSNSAGLVNLEEIKIQSFQDARVWINTNIGLAGTTFSRGTPANTVDNPTDARVIADANTLERFHLNGTITLPNGEEFAGSDWLGHSIVSSKIILNNVSVNGAYFNNLEIEGQCNGYVDIENCKVQNITNFAGIMQDCSVEDISVSSTNTQLITIINCRSHNADMTQLDMNSSNCHVMVKDYFGGLQIDNFDQGNNISIDMSSGKVHITSSCTSGTIIVRGIAELIDESGPGCTVVTSGLTNLKALTKNQFIALS